MSSRVLQSRPREPWRLPGRGAALVVAVALAAACTGAAEAPRDASVPAPDERVRWAIEDAAGRAGVPLDEVVVVVSRHVTWSDGALGCPQPGMIYTQALVQGYRIVLQVSGRLLSYHASERGRPFLCPEDRVQPPSADTRPD